MKLVLPHSTVALIDKVSVAQRHVGLQLDKYSVGGEQTEQKDVLGKVCQVAGDAALFEALSERRQKVLHSLPGLKTFSATTTGPLTLHLARASALENAGICLHPLYGFVYLPGTGLKGMAHAYAETVWLPTQPEQRKAWQQIEDVFGWAPNLDRQKQIKDPKHPAEHRRQMSDDPKSPELTACAGAVVFHDAWPVSWPKLNVDILNNHHATYYQDGEPPGDWDAPVPVYFLAVGPGETFQFAVTERRSTIKKELIDLACSWLLGALVHQGAGAKTATGYGCFKQDVDSQPFQQEVFTTWEDAKKKRKRSEFACVLELASPAFLAGANQYGPLAATNCDLRPATVRGLLRWWWRTLHAAHVDAPTLANLEAAVWGDVNGSGAVRVTVESVSSIVPRLYDKNFICQMNELPRPLNNKTTQGVWYHSFGMDDKRREKGVLQRFQRYFLAPGAKWRLRLIARPSVYEARDRLEKVVHNDLIGDSEMLLQQAQAALWLLCRFGGVGSKSRKGFGSLAELPELSEWNLGKCKEAGRVLRLHCHIPKLVAGMPPAGSPSLEHMLPPIERPSPWTNYWYVLDQVGALAQRFAQDYAHNPAKKALGLPRKVDSKVPFLCGPHVKKTDRHAAPVLYHLAPDPSGFVLRVVAFPSPELPNLTASQELLNKLLRHLQTLLPQWIDRQAKEGRTPPVNAAALAGGNAAAVSTPAAPRLPKPGDRVDAVLVADPKGKDRRFARHEPSGLVGPITNGSDVPKEKQLGDSVPLIVASLSSDGKQIQFRYPTAADDAKGNVRPSGKPGGGPFRGPRPKGGKR